MIAAPSSAVSGTFAKYSFRGVPFAIWCDPRGGRWCVDTRAVKGGCVSWTESPSAAVLLGRQIVDAIPRPYVLIPRIRLPSVPPAPKGVGEAEPTTDVGRTRTRGARLEGAGEAEPTTVVGRTRTRGARLELSARERAQRVWVARRSGNLRHERLLVRARAAVAAFMGLFTKRDLSAALGSKDKRHGQARLLLLTMEREGLVRFVTKRPALGGRGYQRFFERTGS